MLFLLLRLKRKIRKQLTVAIILILFLSLFLGIIGFYPITQELKTIGTGRGFDRFYVLKDSPKIIKDFPLFGVGLGAFGEIFGKYKTFAPQTIYNFAHNEPMQILVETGLVGFLLIASFFYIYCKNIFYAWLKRRDSFAVYLGLGAIISLFSITLHSLFDFVFHVPANALLFFIILGLVCRIVYMEGIHGAPSLDKFRFILPKASGAICIIALGIGFLASALFIQRRCQAESIFNSVKQYKIAQGGIETVLDYKKVLREIDKAIALNPENSAYLNKKADLLSELAINSELNNELIAPLGLGGASDLLSLAELDYKRAIEINPTKADYHLRLGWLYGELADVSLMRQEFKRALLLDPQNSVMKAYIEKYPNP